MNLHKKQQITAMDFSQIKILAISQWKLYLKILSIYLKVKSLELTSKAKMKLGTQL